jgi:hypothetical protein
MSDFSDKVGMTALASIFAFVPYVTDRQGECPDGLWCEQAAIEPMHTHEEDPMPWRPTLIEVRTSTVTGVGLGGTYS